MLRGARGRRRVPVRPLRTLRRRVAGPVTVQIGNRFMNADCFIGPPSSEPLIGQIVLEALDLVADCANRTVGPCPESPDSPLLKLNGATLTVTLPSGVTFAGGVSASSFALVTTPAIPGLSIGGITGGASGATTATLTLATGAVPARSRFLVRPRP